MKNSRTPLSSVTQLSVFGRMQLGSFDTSTVAQPQGNMMNIQGVEIRLVRSGLGVLAVVCAMLFVGCSDSRFAKDSQVEPPRIEWLNNGKTAIIHQQVLDADLADELLAHPDLEDLRIKRSRLVDESFLPTVATLPQLRVLSVLEVSVNDEDIRCLRDARQLQSLELYNLGIDGSVLTELHHLPLNRLVLSDVAIGRNGMQALGGFRDLEELELNVPNACIADIPSLAGATNLRSFVIHNGIFSYREFGGLKCLMGVPQLEQLELAGYNLNERVLRAVESLPTLASLDIERHRISAQATQDFIDSQLVARVSITAPVGAAKEAVVRLAERVDNVASPKS